MADVPSPPSRDLLHVIGDEARYGAHFLHRHGWRVAFGFVFLLLPIWGFAAMVGELHENEVFAFDAPTLLALHRIATPALDRFFVLVSHVGFSWGVIPADVVVFAFLAVRRRFRDTLFFGLAVVGSAVLDVAGKIYFARARPDLWLSITPESSYSFPSGHAMGSASLAAAMIVLCWRTRWRWLAVAAGIVFVVLVGTSRVYLGVHYPSDILAGWCAATAWVVGIFVLVNRRAPAPPSGTARSDDTVGT